MGNKSFVRRKVGFLVRITILSVLLAITLAGVGCVRKELPYAFELVPRSNGIGITNTAGWNVRDLVISWNGKDGHGKGSAVMKGSLNQYLIDGLKDGVQYAINIKRADLAGRVRYKPYETEVVYQKPSADHKYVVLVGASVGKMWDLPSWPKRTGNTSFVFGYRGKYSYDKRDLIEPLTKGPLKPDAVIIKECAAYFPKELKNVIEKLPGWVNILTANGVTPVLATCCPVTEANDKANPGRQNAIDQFNLFVRTYAADHGLAVLDLAKTLQTSETNHFLQRDYADPDGLHLAAQAYGVLDSIIVPSIGGDARMVFEAPQDTSRPQSSQSSL